MKDVKKLRIVHKQWETARVVYRHESWYELWGTFQNKQTITDTEAGVDGFRDEVGVSRRCLLRHVDANH